MRRLSDHFLWIAVIASALLLFAVAGLVGGPDNLRDIAVIQSLEAERAARPLLSERAIVVTHIGGVLGMIPIMVIAALLLAVAKRWRDAAALAVIVLGGRAMIESFKILINRPRPDFSPFPVEVTSLSFPSGHAGNSMITFLAIALIATPLRWRGVVVTAAILGSLAIGATRPLLGVHWPSDVIGGWAFGIGWVVGLVALTRKWRGAAE